MQLASCPSCTRREGLPRSTRSNATIRLGGPRRLPQQQLVCKAESERQPAARSSHFDKAGTALTGAIGVLGPLLADVQPASAHDPLLQGRYVSLVHPALMIFLFVATAWTGWLGLQWRRLRTIPGTIKDLKGALPKPDSEGKRPPSPFDDEIKQLEAERKELSGKDLKGVHHNWGSLLLGLGTVIALVGPINTYLRLGKLFPGPHLYAGAGIVALWALASAMVPYMAKGSDVARTLHITFNCINLALFAWQIPTGIEIVQKVLQFAPVP